MTENRIKIVLHPWEGTFSSEVFGDVRHVRPPYQVPAKIQKPYDPSLNTNQFSNSCSMEGFILPGARLEEVIAQDRRELQQIGGSFEAIADRMCELIEKADEAGRLPGTVIEPGMILAYMEMTRGMRGSQGCPFRECRVPIGASRVYGIQNHRTGRTLGINTITEHLAKDHHLLQKGNRYGISAAEFYRHFMSQSPS